MTSAQTTSPPSKRRVRTPTVLQMEAVECGAAALGIVLAHFGRRVPLDELRTACGVSRDGVKASRIVKTARAYGLVAKGVRAQPAEVRRESLPAIAFWGLNHFVVIEGYAPGVWYLNDPASGPRTVSEDEFDGAFTGVLLVFDVGPDFKPGGRPPGLMATLGRRLVGVRPALLYVVLAGLALVLPGLATAVFTKTFVDQVLVGGRTDQIWLLVGWMLATAAVTTIATWLRLSVLLRLQTTLSVRGSGEFLWHILRLPAAFYSQRYGGEVASRVAINDRVARLLSGDLATAALDVLLVVFFLVVMAGYSIWLTLIGAVAAAVNVVVLRTVSRHRRDAAQVVLRERGKVLGTAMGGLQTIETLKASGRESDFFGRWAGHHAKAQEAQTKLDAATPVLTVVPTLTAALTTAAILGFGGVQVVSGYLSLGTLIAFQALMTRFSEPVGRFVGLGGTVQEISGDLARLEDVLGNRTDWDGDLRAQPSSDAPALLAGRLELRDVSFGYSTYEPPLISRFNLIIEPGRRVALVGGSGSGKSTISRLVAGLYAPWTGEIMFDGLPRDRLPRSLLTSSVALVDQNVALFEGTVRENLTLWDPTVPEATLVQAAHDARIHDDISARPGRYDSVVAEGGANWSGGQAQRLEIARALAGRPAILILDEATSALDPATEELIDQNLRRRGCTCLLVAHRLSTIRDCDEIIVLEHGQVVQRGTHDEMIAVEGPYARLVSGGAGVTA